MAIFLPYAFIVFHLFFVVLIAFLCIGFFTGAPFVPSTNKTANRMIELARIRKGMTIYDLGSGDGKLLLLAVKKGATAIGYEIHPLLVWYTKLRVLFSSQRTQITVYWKNYWSAPLTDADVVFIYLLPWRMEKLEAKLSRELKPGTLVVSNSFIFPHWKILRQDIDAHVYVFKIPTQHSG